MTHQSNARIVVALAFAAVASGCSSVPARLASADADRSVPRADCMYALVATPACGQQSALDNARKRAAGVCAAKSSTVTELGFRPWSTQVVESDASIARSYTTRFFVTYRFNCSAGPA
jgi:hypothetical protein